MNFYFLLATLGTLFCFYIWLGKQAANKVEDTTDYFLMGRNLTFFPMMMTLLATQLGGGMILGTAQEAYQHGWIILLYPLSTFIGYLIIGLGYGARLRKMNITTISEIFEKIYGCRTLRQVASSISIISLFLVLVAQGLTVKTFLSTTGLVHPLWFNVFWATFVAYTTMGGFKAVVDTDVVQGLFIVFGLLVTASYISPALLNFNFTEVFTTTTTSIPWVSWLLMPPCFMMIEQDIGQRCFAAKTPQTIAPASLVAGFFLLLCAGITICFGMLAKNMNFVVDSSKSVFVEIVNHITNPIVSAVFIGIIIMAVASTADSRLCSIGSHLSFDFLGLDKNSSSQKVLISRLLTVLTGTLALVFVYMAESIIGTLMLSYQLSVCALLISVLMAVFSSQPSRIGAYFSMFFGVSSFLVFYFSQITLPKEPLCIAISLLGYFLGKGIDSLQSNQQNKGNNSA